MEVRFITGNDGIADALAVAVRKHDSEQAQQAAHLAVTRIKERWFHRAENVGLHTSISARELDELCDAYLQSVAGDPVVASRTLVNSIMARVAGSIDADRWVDTTPANARKADKVELIYPDSVVVIVHRDGRDVAASFAHQSFGPDDVFEALGVWEQRMGRIHRAVVKSRPDRIVQVDLVDLVINDRHTTLERICTAIDVPLDPGMVEWFDQNVTEKAAHGGRWRRDFDESTVDRLDHAYGEACDRLAREGVRIPPAA